MKHISERKKMAKAIYLFLTGRIESAKKIVSLIHPDLIYANDSFRFIEWCIEGHSSVFFTQSSKEYGNFSIAPSSVEMIKFFSERAKEIYEIALNEGDEETILFTKAVWKLSEAICDDIAFCNQLSQLS